MIFGNHDRALPNHDTSTQLEHVPAPGETRQHFPRPIPSPVRGSEWSEAGSGARGIRGLGFAVRSGRRRGADLAPQGVDIRLDIGKEVAFDHEILFDVAVQVIDPGIFYHQVGIAVQGPAGEAVIEVGKAADHDEQAAVVQDTDLVVDGDIGAQGIEDGAFDQQALTGGVELVQAGGDGLEHFVPFPEGRLVIREEEAQGPALGVHHGGGRG